VFFVSEIKIEVERKNTDPLLDLTSHKDGNLDEVIFKLVLFLF
jgi:hypothetical protein